MRLTAAEKHEIIRLVKGSDLSVRRPLRELGVHRSTFYAWYRRYQDGGAAGLSPRPSAARRHWNRLPPRVRRRVVEAALADPAQSPWRASWQRAITGAIMSPWTTSRQPTATTGDGQRSWHAGSESSRGRSPRDGERI